MPLALLRTQRLISDVDCLTIGEIRQDWRWARAERSIRYGQAFKVLMLSVNKLKQATIASLLKLYRYRHSFGCSLNSLRKSALCPLWVKSGHFPPEPKESAFGGRADIQLQQHNLSHQYLSIHTQRIRNLFDNPNRRVSRASFDPTNIGPMKAGLECKFLLRPAFFFPDPFHIEANLFADIHPAKSPQCLLSVYRL
jgi:hypothetical protein